MTKWQFYMCVKLAPPHFIIHFSKLVYSCSVNSLKIWWYGVGVIISLHNYIIKYRNNLDSNFSEYTYNMISSILVKVKEEIVEISCLQLWACDLEYDCAHKRSCKLEHKIVIVFWKNEKDLWKEWQQGDQERPENHLELSLKNLGLLYNSERQRIFRTCLKLE